MSEVTAHSTEIGYQRAAASVVDASDRFSAPRNTRGKSSVGRLADVLDLEARILAKTGDAETDENPNFLPRLPEFSEASQTPSQWRRELHSGVGPPSRQKGTSGVTFL